MTGRAAQRRRTRAAIVAAARELVAEGQTPSVDMVAAAAEVSRRTVYLHFPSIDQLILDATLGELSESRMAETIEQRGSEGDVHGRVEALVRTMLELAPTTLPLGRRIIRLTVEDPGGDVGGKEGGERRGFRRVRWVETALEPLRGRVDEERFERLVSALTVLIGFESMVVLRDVRDLDPEAEAAVTSWAARVLLDATLAEVDESSDSS